MLDLSLVASADLSHWTPPTQQHSGLVETTAEKDHSWTLVAFPPL